MTKRLQQPWRVFVPVCTAAAAVAVLLGLRFGYWYDLNDDVLIRDILSGIYSGQPQARDIQQLYPLGLLIGLLYRIPGASGIDWYGGFLLLCQWGCVALTGCCAAGCMAGRKKTAWFVAALGMCCLLTVMLPRLVFVQYSITTAMLVAAAAYLLLTTRARIMPLVFLLLAYTLRSEMTLLLLPLVGVVLLFRMADELAGADRDRGHSQPPDYGRIIPSVAWILILLAGLALLTLWNHAAYSAPGWRAYNDFFDARTELYDFQSIPDYAGHRAFYDGIGLSEEEQVLLENYNFGLDEAIDAETLRAVADYARSLRTDGSLLDRMWRALPLYLYRLRNFHLPQSVETPQTDAPWNLLIGLGYLFWCIAGLRHAVGQVREGRKLLRAVMGFIWQPVLLFFVRSGLLLYMMAVGRDPVRITHGIFLTETLILAGCLLRREAAVTDTDSAFTGKAQLVCAAGLLLIVICYLPAQLRMVAREEENRRSFNQAYGQLEETFAAHPEEYYLMDVYTSVSYDHTAPVTYSAEMFHMPAHTGTARPAAGMNHDLCGGWYCKSPAQEAKLTDRGLPEEMGEALLEEKVCFVTAVGEETDWLCAFYASKGIPVQVERTACVAEVFDICRVRRVTP